MREALSREIKELAAEITQLKMDYENIVSAIEKRINDFDDGEDMRLKRLIRFNERNLENRNIASDIDKEIRPLLEKIKGFKEHFEGYSQSETMSDEYKARALETIGEELDRSRWELRKLLSELATCWRDSIDSFKLRPKRK
ncbi:MAG: hypothetical protein ACD_9C00157G0004 [uncultured bacterium]|nr:MAG: hypothetical protein ACD_9C00157G0004 [uncultured bacterium]